MTKTAPMPEIPTRERVAMRTQLMATQRMELAATRVSELPAEMAAALAKIADAAARFAANEARACVYRFVVALNAGALEPAKRSLEGYVSRVGFIGAPSADVQATLRADLALTYSRMSPERKRQLDELFADVRRRYPKAWITQPF
jgi:hypothetical protein